MATKKTVAIIGADSGNIGWRLAKSLNSPEYRLLLLSSGFDSLDNLYNEILASHPATDIELVPCPVDASWEADIILLNIACSAENEMSDKIKQVATGKIVIHVTDKPAIDFTEEDQEKQAGKFQTLLPHSKVVCVYNTHFSNAGEKGENAIVVFDTENADARQSVILLLSAAGINAISAREKEVSLI